jgi:hypothetical protein
VRDVFKLEAAKLTVIKRGAVEPKKSPSPHLKLVFYRTLILFLRRNTTKEYIQLISVGWEILIL